MVVYRGWVLEADGRSLSSIALLLASSSSIRSGHSSVARITMEVYNKPFYLSLSQALKGDLLIRPDPIRTFLFLSSIPITPLFSS